MNRTKHSIYCEIFAHRGFHLNYPENTLEAFTRAVKQNFSIEVDIRFLKCGSIVCFHDRYMKRLLGVPGRISNRTFKEIENYTVNKTKCKVPKLKDVLSMLDGKKAILIEIKDVMSYDYQKALEKEVKDYKGKIYFHTKNIFTYFKAKRVWKDNVFYIFNPFRKRFQFVKGKDYKNVISLPAIDDIIVESEDSAKTVINKIWKTCNKYSTRVKEGHWLLEYNGKKNQIQHRGIVDKNLKEHSKEAFEKCVELQKVIEFDVLKYKNNIVCYHNDNISSKLGQKKSICEKCNIKNALTLKQILSIVDGNVPIIIDIKDYSIFDRSFEDNLMNELKGYKGEFAAQSFNPLVNMYFMKNYEYVIRGQVGHSLNGLKKLRKVILTIVNFILFYRGRPDYIVYDLDPNVYLLSRFNNVVGLPVIGYTIYSKADIPPYSNFFDNFIVEGTE